MIERTIEQAEDGSYYCIDAVTLEYNEEETKETTQFFINPNALYTQIHDYIVKLSGTKIELTGNAEQDKLKKRMVSLIRACIKGGLILWGNDLLTLLYGTKEHAKPERKDDIVDWYMDEFTKIGIANMMKTDIVLVGKKALGDENRNIIQVHRCFTRPISKEEVASSSTENSII